MMPYQRLPELLPELFEPDLLEPELELELPDVPP
jgi:hypothetical protein